MPDHKFRFGLLTAVSASSQVGEDKGSLDDQERFARVYALEEGGIETAGPYIIDGDPRTDYFNLSDALADIPELKEAVEAAEANKFDVLIVHNWDRLGEIGHMLRIKFRQLRKQLKSARQRTRIQDPATYNPRADESAAMEMSYNAAITEYRINNIVRAFDVGATKRVETGRYSRGFPSGYIKVDSYGNLEIDAPVANLYILLKDKFLEGLSLRDLEKVANESGVPSPDGNPHWNNSSIRNILANPFYAGKVFKNRWKQVGKKISSNGKRYPIVRLNPNPTFLDGKHTALWTFAEYERIITELEERYRKNPRHNPRTFSGLLYCGICNSPMTFKAKKYRCRKHQSHNAHGEAEAERGIGEKLARALQEYDEAPPTPPAPDLTQRAKAAIDKQIEKIQRQWLEDEENRVLTDARAREMIKELEERKAKLDYSEAEHARKIAAHDRILEIRRANMDTLNELPVLLQSGNKERSNRFLRDILERIEIMPEGECRFYFR